jgi:N-acyl-L-homoserine lactone synthetase
MGHTTSDDGRVLEHLDEAARRLIDGGAPVRFDLTRSAAEREAVFRLRFDTVVEEGWTSAATFPDGLERDADDAAAVHVAGWHGSTLVAAARLVFPEPRRQLPTEREFELVIEPRNAVVDIGRAIVAPPYRSGQHTIFAALLARCWLEVRARGLHHLCGAATASRLARYRQFGLPLRVLGPARRYWGEERYPLFLDGVEFGRSVTTLSGRQGEPGEPAGEASRQVVGRRSPARAQDQHC